MNPLRKNPTGRAVLGAMAWRLPEDNWVSPWGFENEWTVPAAPPEEGQSETAGQQPRPPLQSREEPLPKRSQADVLAEQRQVGAIFKFDSDEDEDENKPALPAPAKPPEPAALKQAQPQLQLQPQEPSPAPSVATPPPDKAPIQEPSVLKNAPRPVPPQTDSASTVASATQPMREPEARAMNAPPREFPSSAAASGIAPLPNQKPDKDKTRPAAVPEGTVNPIAATLGQVQAAPGAPAARPSTATAAAPAIARSRSPERIAGVRSAVSWGMLMAMAIVLFGLTLLAYQYLHDKPREADDDLRPEVAVDQTPLIQAPVKLRAFLDSVFALQATDIPAGTPWTWDTPALSRYVGSNGTALDNLRDLLEDYDWHPRHSDWHRADLSTHAAWPHAIRLLQAQGAYLARRGDEAPAFATAIDLAEMARRLQEVWAWPGYMERSLQVHSAATESLAELLRQTRLPGGSLASFQNEFQQCRLEDRLLQQACAAYYLHEKKLLLGRASGELLDTLPGGQMHQRPGRLFFKMNETLADFASAFRELRSEIARPPYTRLSANPVPTGSLRLKPTRFYHPNASGESYFNDRIIPYLDLPDKLSLAKARHGLVMCLFALRHHLAEQKTLPSSLADLVPGSLDSLPADPFSGEPYHYDPQKGLLYSVGKNLIAEGGRKGQTPLEDEREPTLELGISVAAVPPAK